jgi:hypothetical protein
MSYINMHVDYHPRSVVASAGIERHNPTNTIFVRQRRLLSARRRCFMLTVLSLTPIAASLLHERQEYRSSLWYRITFTTDHNTMMSHTVAKLCLFIAFDLSLLASRHSHVLLSSPRPAVFLGTYDYT